MPRNTEHVNYPHEPGYLYDCPACESSCHCTPDHAECVWVGHDEARFIAELDAAQNRGDRGSWSP